MKIDKIKNNGEVFTPQNVVEDMLLMIGYKIPFKVEDTKNVLKKHIIDSSCGDGAFLKRIVIRYISNFIFLFKNTVGLTHHLESYIHGIEIDEENYKKCIENLNSIEFCCGEKIEKLSDYNINWDVRLGDALTINDFDGKMDYIVGNPPYVRVHNLQNKKVLKKYMFCDDGMTDLYLAFFELSFRQLNSTGKMAFITPNSWLTSNAGQMLREYIKDNKNLAKIVDFGHFQAFNGITTYSLISVFNKDKNYGVECYGVDDEGDVIYEPQYIIKYADLFINNHIYICSEKEREIIVKVMKETPNKKYRVKNGFATLADGIFIRPLPSDLEYEIPVCKASTGEYASCIFPYKEDGKPYSEEEFKKNAPFIYKQLLENKDKLLNRSIKNKDEWYLFGRTQAINDVYKDKISVPNILKGKDDFLKKVKKVPYGSGVYGGIYILGDCDEIMKKISSDDFIMYVKALKKYKNGGYYTFSSRDLEKYLNNW